MYHARTEVTNLVQPFCFALYLEEEPTGFFGDTESLSHSNKSTAAVGPEEADLHVFLSQSRLFLYPNSEIPEENTEFFGFGKLTEPIKHAQML